MKLPLAEIDESLTAQSPRLKRRIFERGTSLFPGARRWRNTIRVTDDEYYQVIVSGSGLASMFNWGDVPVEGGAKNEGADLQAKRQGSRTTL